MNISTRMMLGLGFVVLLLVLLGTTGQIALASLGNAVEALMSEDYAAAQAAGELARAVDRQDAAAYAWVLGDTTGYAAKRETAATAEYQAARELAGKGAAGSPVEALLGRVDEARGRYDDALQRLRAAPRGPDAVNLYYGVVEPEYERLSASISALGKEARARGGDTGADALRVAWRTRAWAGVITASAFAALIWTVTHLYRTIVWPLGEMATTARAIAGGDMNRRLRAGGKDEFGELSRLLNSMADRLYAKERQTHQRDIAHEQMLESVLERWSEGLAVVDGTGRILAANARFRKALHGLDRSGKGELRLDEMVDIEREKLVFREKRALGELVRMLPPRLTQPDGDPAGS